MSRFVSSEAYGAGSSSRQRRKYLACAAWSMRAAMAARLTSSDALSPLASWTMTWHPCDVTLDFTPAALRAAATYPQRPPRRDVTLTTAVLSLALTHATCLTLATLALALALAALALTVRSRTSRPGSSSTKGMWNSKKGLPHPPSSRYNCRAHTDAASVCVLSARGRPSRGAGETGSHTTAAGSNPNAITTEGGVDKNERIDSSTEKG